MGLHAPGPRRERILVFGESGSGKSSTWTSIAEWMVKTGSGDTMYVTDTDKAWEAMRPVDGRLDKTCSVDDARNYSQIKASLDRALKLGSTNDWLVVDMIDQLWVRSQRHYFDEAMESDLGDFFLEAKKGGPSVAGEYGTNWNVINKLYGDLTLRIYDFPGHVLCCTPAGDLRQPNRDGKGGDDVKVRQMFNRVGMKPEGQKALPFLFHTIILTQEASTDWRLTTVKDRQRERVVGKVVTEGGGFPMSYLIPTAGWKP
jgi:ABC-type dipeptide/oligopeptide/nickel transport system ATPase component